MRLSVLNGPNLGRLGIREPELYGSVTLPELQDLCLAWGREHGHEVLIHQVDAEGELVARIHEADTDSAGLVLNAAAYTHTSVAVRDAVLSISIPVVEIHLTNPAARDELRRRNLLSDVVQGTVAGFGAAGYPLALQALTGLLAGDS